MALNRFLSTALAVSVSAAGLSAPISAHAQYTERYLFSTTTSSGGSEGHQASFLNDNGLVAGRYGMLGKSVSGQAKIWDASGTGAPALLWTEPPGYAPGGPIAGSVAVDINNTSVLFPHMVENVTSHQPVANLGANAFNDQGLVVGVRSEFIEGVGWTSNAKWAASPSGAAQAITVAGNQQVKPTQVNNVGQVIGTGTFANQTQAFVFDVNTSQSHLLFNSPLVTSSEVWDINDAGQILGKKTLSSGVSSAFLFNTADGTFQDLPTSTNPLSPTQKGALNNQGQIVFDNLFFDGQNWIDLRQSNGFTGTLTGLDINNNGQILLSHFYYTGAYSMGGTPLSNNYKNDYLILTTVPEPASVLSMGLGLAGLAWILRRHRRQAALSA